MYDTSDIDQNQLLLVRFQNLGSDDVIVPGMANLSFTTELPLKADARGALVSNVGRMIVKKLAVKFKGMRYWVWTISTCLHATKTCGRQHQKSRMQ